MIFMMINGCKMDNSESISIGNQINSSLASKKRSGFADYFGKGIILWISWINMMEIYRRSETGITGFDFFYGFIYIDLANINILD